MELRTLEGKNVRLTDVEGEVFEGIVGEYVYPDCNEPEGIEAIVLDYPIKADGTKCLDLIQFNASDIKYIEII